MNDDDVDRRLRAHADEWRAAQPPPPQPDVRRLSSATPRYWLAGVAAAVAAVVVVGTATLFPPEPERPSGASATPTETTPTTVPTAATSEPSPTPKRCRPLDVRPSYLPWLDAGEPVPEPEISSFPPRSQQSPQITLLWAAPSSRLPDLYYVSLRRYSESIGRDSNQLPVPRLLGEPGVYHAGSTPGDGAILWDSPYWPCNVVSLALVADDRFTRAETRAVLVRIARSLR